VQAEPPPARSDRGLNDLLLQVLWGRAISRLEDDGDIVLGRSAESQQGGQSGSGLAAAVRTDVPARRGEKIRADIQLRSFPTDSAHGIPDTLVQLDKESTMTHLPTSCSPPGTKIFSRKGAKA
jgi:hypothetical protein